MAAGHQPAGYAIDLADVEAAASRIEKHIHRTPVSTSATFDDQVGHQCFFKCELFQKGGSFKSRGATNAVLKLAAEAAARGVCTHSSGNHAQALAIAARSRGVPAYIVMPSTAPPCKKLATAGYGATVTECDPALRAEACGRVEAATGAVFIHPSNNVDVMAGQGTMALELLQQVAAMESTPEGTAPLDAVVVPLGGGGMLSGVATACKALWPDMLVIGAEPAAADDAFRSVEAGRILGHESPPNTIADGLRTTLGDKNFPIIRDKVDAIVLVEEAAIVSGMRFAWERLKLAVEPSAGTGIAAVCSERGRQLLAGRHKVGIILCGGNIDLDAPLPWQARAAQ